MKSLTLYLRHNWKLILLILAFLISNNLNHIIGFYTAYHKGLNYLSIPFVNSGDHFVYLSNIEQGAQGKMFIDNLFNYKSQNRDLFAPHWYLMGQFSNLFNSSIVSYFIIRIISSLIFILVLIWLLKKIFGEKIFWPLFFILFSNGFAYLAYPSLEQYNILPTSIWMPESITFDSLTQSPLFIMSQTLILLTFLLFIKAYESKKTIYIILLLASNLFLSLIHPYDIPIILSVGGMTAICIIYLNKSKKIIPYYLGLLLTSLPMAYYYWWLLQDPVMSEHHQQNILKSPNLLSYIIGYGLILVLFVFGLVYIKKNKELILKNNYLLLVCLWSLMGFILVYLPLDFNRRLSNGWHIALCIIAFYGIKYLNKKSRLKYIYLSVITFFIFFDTLLKIILPIYYLEAYNNMMFFDNDRKAIWQKIKQESKPGDIFLSYPNDGIQIPAFTARNVYIGHRMQTWEFDKKNKELQELLAKPQDISTWLKEKGIDYIFISSDFVSDFNEKKWLSNEPYLQTIINNERFILLKVLAP